MSEYVYVIVTHDGTAKVGYTSRSPRGRLAVIENCPADLVRVIEGGIWDERIAHQDLARHRIDERKNSRVCEWYKNPTAVLKYFEDRQQATCPQCSKRFPVLRKLAGNNRWKKIGKRTSILCFCGRDAPVVPLERGILVIE